MATRLKLEHKTVSLDIFRNKKKRFMYLLGMRNSGAIKDTQYDLCINLPINPDFVR